MNTKKQEAVLILLKYTVAVFIFWSTLNGLSLWFNIQDEQIKTIDVVKNIAKSNFNKDQAYRKWATSHGGVYVVPTKEKPPISFLSRIKDRDITSTNGKELTLIDPASMTSEIMKDFEYLYGIKGKLAGIVYLNPKNKATPLEEKAIKQFEKGVKEVTKIVGKGKNESFNLIGPIFMEEGCKKCHGHLGFENGEVRGSLGISVPLSPFRNIENELIKGTVATYFIIWIVGVFALTFIYFKMKRNLIEKVNYETKINNFNLELQDTVDEKTKDLKEKNAELYDLANKDYLTQISNRRSYFLQSEQLLEKSIKHEKSFCVLMIDIDFFKKINDVYGHAVGDKILIEFCNIVNSIITKEQVFGRIGGEEFCITFYDKTIDEAFEIAENIREKCQNEILDIDDKKINFTISLGLSHKLNATKIDEILNFADELLYEAKGSGRNIVIRKTN